MFQRALSSLSSLTHLLAICGAADSVTILPHPGRALVWEQPFLFLLLLESTVMFYSYTPSSLSKQHFQDPLFFFLSLQMKFLYLPSGVFQVPSPSADISISAICSKYSCYNFSVVWLLLSSSSSLIVFEFKDLHLIFLHHCLFLCYFWHLNLSFFLPPLCFHSRFMSYTLIYKISENNRMLYILILLREKMTLPLTFFLGY